MCLHLFLAKENRHSCIKKREAPKTPDQLKSDDHARDDDVNKQQVFAETNQPTSNNTGTFQGHCRCHWCSIDWRWPLVTSLMRLIIGRNHAPSCVTWRRLRRWTVRALDIVTFRSSTAAVQLETIMCLFGNETRRNENSIDCIVIVSVYTPTNNHVSIFCFAPTQRDWGLIWWTHMIH